MPNFLINRSKLLEEVLEGHGWESCRDCCTDEYDFVMWDKCSKPNIAGPPEARLLTLLGPEAAHIDNKRHLYNACRHRMSDLLPETYLDRGEVPPSDAADGDASLCPLWFLKKAFTAGGKDVHCGPLSDMVALWEAQPKERDWVLQRGVRSCLLEGRKWTLRVYVLLLPDLTVWVHEEGLAIVHKQTYTENVGSVDRDVHIDHKGCTRHAFTDLPFHAEVLPNVVTACARLFKSYAGKMNSAQDPTRYHLFGLDFIIGGAMEPYLIEVNQFPNMSINSGVVGRFVKRTLFEDLYRLLIAPAVLGSEPEAGGFQKCTEL